MAENKEWWHGRSLISLINEIELLRKYRRSIKSAQRFDYQQDNDNPALSGMFPSIEGCYIEFPEINGL